MEKEKLNIKEVDPMEDPFEDFDLTTLDEFIKESEKPPEEPEVPTEEPKEKIKEEIESSKDEEEKEEEDLEESKKEGPSSQNTKESPLTPYAKMLVEEGLLPEFDENEFDGTVESFVELQRNYDQKRFEEFKSSSLDPRVKWLQDNLEQGVPFTKLLEFDEKQTAVSTITEDSLKDNIELQKEVVRRYYEETTTLSEDRIDNLIKRLETLDELDIESVTNLGELKSILQEKEEQERLTVQQQQEYIRKENEKFVQTFNKSLEETKEIIPGIKMSSLIKDRVKRTLMTPVAVNPHTGEPMNKIAQARAENPIDFEIKLAYLFEVTKGFTDMTSLAASGKKKTLEEFEKAVQSIDTTKQTYKPQYSKERQRTFIKEAEEIGKFLG